MSNIERNDLRPTAEVTDETLAFKKPYQTVGRPPVTQENVNDQYMRDPPHNEPFGPSTARRAPGKKEGAWEYEEKETGGNVLVDGPAGRTKHEAVMGGVTQENTVHPNALGDMEA